MSILEKYEAADKAFRSDSVLDEDNATLLRYLSGLSNQINTNAGTQHRDLIRSITINHVLLQRHIDALQEHITGLDRKNATLQKWVIALAAAALISTFVQSAIALLTYTGSPSRSEAKSVESPTTQEPIRPAEPEQ